jgi:hypothetical protein
MNAHCRSIAIAPAVTLALLFTLTIQSRAAIDDSVPAPQFITQLEQRASQAQPREQLFLYTQLVHSMTQLAGKQFFDGEYEEGAATLKKVEHYAQLIHNNLAKDTKRVKDAEMLMEHTTVRLGEFMHHASGDDREALQATLKKLDHVHDELLAQVFVH